MKKICGECKNYKPVKLYKDGQEDLSEGICPFIGDDVLLNFFEPACNDNFDPKEEIK